VVVLLVAIALVFRFGQFLVFQQQVQWGYDFSFYWTAGGHLLHGEPIYSAQQLSGPYAPQGQEGFLYPPPFAAVIVSLTALFPTDYRAAMWVWFAIGFVIVIASVLALARAERDPLEARFRVLRGNGRWLLVAAAFALPPVVGELVLGNVHVLLLGLLTVAWLGIGRDDSRGEALAGVAVGIAAVIKVFPGLLLVWFLATRRWRAAAWTVVGALAFTLVTLPVTGFAPWLDLPTALTNLSAPSDLTDALAPTVWLAPFVGSFTVARIVVTVLALALAWWAGRALPSARSYAIVVLASVLVAPALYHHYLAILVLPLVLGLASRASLPLLAAAYFLMWGGEQSALGEWAWVMLRVVPTLGMLALLGALATRMPVDAPSGSADTAGPVAHKASQP
jgi:hypothetical protein